VLEAITTGGGKVERWAKTRMWLLRSKGGEHHRFISGAGGKRGGGQGGRRNKETNYNEICKALGERKMDFEKAACRK